jgi:methylglyoxal synthase
MAANRRGSRTAQGSGRRSAAKKPARRRKTLALIAHDGKKADMLAFAIDYLAVLKRYRLVGTKTTGSLIAENTGLKIESMLSGPMGGDAQIAAMVAQKEIAAVFFFVDPLGKHPHDPDIQTLMRICNVHSVPLATNPATAGYVISEKAL